MQKRASLVLTAILIGPLALHAQAAPPRSAPAARFVTVQPGVRLEVLDWGGPQQGGPGQSLVFLAGLGNTAHAFDNFAPRFTAKYHVYGITRRGFGASSKPDPTVANYSAQRLGEDVLAVIDALHLDRPVLIGHSIAGEELSYVGTHDPQKVAGLIYLDAADAYGFYDAARGNIQLDLLDVQHRLEAFREGQIYDRAFVDGLQTSVAQLDRDLKSEQERLAGLPGVPPPPPPPAIPLAVLFGEEKFTKIEAPAMAIFACPHDMSPAFRGPLAHDLMDQGAMKAEDYARCTAQSNAFERAMPADPVVRIANADHYVYLSNPDIVERAIEDFVARLR